MKKSPPQQANSSQETYTPKGPHLTLPIFGKVPLRPREYFAALRIKEHPPLWAQLTKYGVCGVISLIVLMLTVAGIKFCFPSFLDQDALSNHQFQINLTIALFCAFVPSNLIAYITNRIFVFTPGKYSWKRELTYFTIISAISFTGGELGKRFMVNNYAENPHIVELATLSFAVSSALVNFVARKYLVFSNEPAQDESNLAQ